MAVDRIKNRPGALGAPLMMQLLITFSVLILLIAVNPTPVRYMAPIYVMSVAFAIICGALVEAIFTDRAKPIYMAALLYLSAYYVGPGIIHLHARRFPFYSLTYSDDAALVASVIILLFSSILIFVNRSHAKTVDIERRTLVRVRFPFVFVGLFGLVISSAALVGFGYLTARRGDVADLFKEVTATQIALSAIARMGSFILFSLSLSFARRVRSIGSVIAVLISLALFLLMNNPISLPRFVIGAYAITFFFAHIKQTKKSRFAFVSLMIIAQLTVFPLLSEWSRGAHTGITLPDPTEYLSTHGDFDGFQSTMNVVLWVEGDGLQDGVQLASAILFFVPREYVPWKSRGTGGDAAKYAGYRFVNISAPMPSEMYVDFGFVGVIVFSIIVALLIRRTDSGYSARSSRAGDFALMTPSIAAGYIFILLRGSLIGVLGPFVLSAGLSFASIWLMTRRKSSRGGLSVK